MELRQLRYFIALAEELNFTRAAARVHVAQPAFGRQIASLEAELGTPLVDRSARPLRITPAGRVALKHARAIQRSVETLKAQVCDAPGASHTFAMGFTSTILYSGFAAFVRRARTLEELMTLKLVQMSSLEQLDALKSGELDVGFNYHASQEPGLESHVLRTERLVAALPCGHELTTCKGALEMRRLAEQRVIIYPKTPKADFSDMLAGLLIRHGADPDHLEMADTPFVALGLVAAQAGVSLVPESFSAARSDDVVFLRLREPDASFRHFLWQRQADDSQVLAIIKRIVLQVHEERGWPEPVDLAS